MKLWSSVMNIEPRRVKDMQDQQQRLRSDEDLLSRGILIFKLVLGSKSIYQ